MKIYEKDRFIQWLIITLLFLGVIVAVLKTGENIRSQSKATFLEAK